jgi:hypothetical protein
MIATPKVSGPQTRLSLQGFRSRALKLGTQVSRSIKTKNSSPLTPKELSSSPAGPSRQEAESLINAESADVLDTLDLSSDADEHDLPSSKRLILGSSGGPTYAHRLERAERLRGPSPYRMPDPNPPMESLGWMPIEPHMSSNAKVLRVINAFRNAVKLVYQQRWAHYLNSEITSRMKHYGAFLAFANELVLHDLSPEKWMIWRLRWFKKSDAFKSKPPFINMIVSAKALKTKGGWCRKEMADEFTSRFVADPLIIEQDLRNREAHNRWLGDVDPYVGTTKTYVKKRESEVERGLVNPLADAVWPRPLRVARRYNLAHVEHQRGVLDIEARSRQVPIASPVAAAWMDDLWGEK